MTKQIYYEMIRGTLVPVHKITRQDSIVYLAVVQEDAGPYYKGEVIETTCLHLVHKVRMKDGRVMVRDADLTEVVGL